MSFGRRFLEEFIEVIKSQPAIWRLSSESYKNKEQRNEAWQIVLKKYQEADEDATLETVKKKFKGMRTAYRREVNKVRISKKYGAEEEDIYVPSLWYFHKLDFLRDQLLREGSPFTTSTDFEEIEIPCSAKKPKLLENDSLKEAVDHQEKSDVRPQRDEADVYAEGWAISFRKLNEEQKIYAKRIMDETLLHGRLGQLSYSSSLNIGVPPDSMHPHLQQFVNSTPNSLSQSSSSTSNEIVR